MHKYTKFIFRELPKAAVANPNDCTLEYVYNQEEIITTAVTQHLQTIISAENAGDTALDILDIQEQHEVDIEQIKTENYNKGFEEAKNTYESTIESLKADHNFVDLLNKQLLSIAPSATDIDKQLIEISIQILNKITSKLHMALPVNFEQILHSEILNSIKKFYKEGQIQLTIHPSKQESCTNILCLDNLPSKLKDNIHVVTDDTIGENDCRAEWSNTRLEYNQAQLDDEISKILMQLNSAI